MANIKKPRSERKKTASFSLKTKHYEDFVDICDRKKLVFSHKIEELIIKFNNDNK